MGYLITAIVFLWVGWKVGRKYSDFADIMLARRIAKLVEQKQQVQLDREQYENWANTDKKLGKMMEQRREVELGD